METIQRTVDAEQVFTEQDRTSSGIPQAHGEIAFLRRRLARLVKLQSLVKQKYHSRLASLSRQIEEIESQQWELKSLGKQLNKNKERQSLIREELSVLERRKRTISQAMRQIEGYRRSSNAQVRVIEEEQEILSQRIHDLEHMLELVEQAELDRKERDIVSQRISATRSLLEEHAAELSKRTIDLLFEFYIPPKTTRRFRF
ncbi:MAG: hypothetical protein IBX67_07620 [Dehalococcoidia bacterium]|nr:hypothetical protein [Dehalococcoidia bacterium]